MELLHKELTRQIRACIFEVRKEIGTGFDEETYHQGLILSFLRHNVPFVSKEKRSLFHRGTLIREFVNDFFLFDKIILSLKCVPCQFLQAHYVQLFSELKLWKSDLGMMANFGLPKLDIERYAFTDKEPDFVENYGYISDRIGSAEQQTLDQIIKATKDVAVLYKLGFGKVVWRKIVETELGYLQIPFSKNTLVPINFAGKTIRTYRLRHLIVDDKILLAVTALQKGIDQIDVANMQSYLKALKLNIGVIVNFGKSQVHISGVRAPKR